VEVKAESTCKPKIKPTHRVRAGKKLRGEKSREKPDSRHRRNRKMLDMGEGISHKEKRGRKKFQKEGLTAFS